MQVGNMTLISNQDSMVHCLTKDMSYNGRRKLTEPGDCNHFYLVKNDCRQWSSVPKHLFTIAGSK